MKIYIVGGAVRDVLLGHAPKDRDWVVVGSSPEEMEASGFKPVGKDFPVFIDPKTGDEYALARTERKTGRGHKGFSTRHDPSVGLEDDLARRDLTINAMAMDRDGTLIDPHGGREDLKNGILRAVSPAFSDDPLRVLRTARFAARYGFEVEEGTLELSKGIASGHEFAELTPERIGMETLKALRTPHPARFFETLRDMEALSVHFPEIAALIGQRQPPRHHPEGDAFVHTMMVLQRSADLDLDLETRFGALVHDLGKGVTPNKSLPRHHGHEEAGVPLVRDLCARIRLSSRLRAAGQACARHHTHVHKVDELHPRTLVKMFKDLGGDQTLEHLERLAMVAMCDAQGRGGEHENRPYPEADGFLDVMRALHAVKVRDLIPADMLPTTPPHVIQETAHRARIAKVREVRRANEDRPSNPKSSWG